MDLQQFLSELRVRKVYRAGAIYAAGAWALLQIADITFPVIGLEGDSIKFVLLFVAAGFPVAMVLAWVFDLTPEGIVETPSAPISPPAPATPTKWAEAAILTTLILLVAVLYVDRLIPGVSNNLGISADPARESIAVIPFVNMSGDRDMEYFGDGLAEEILNLLTKLNELDVAARTSSFFFKDKEVDIPTIGNHLGVSHVLEGSIRQEGQHIRITVQLINTGSGFHLWSETYTREMSNIFTLQDEIAGMVVEHLDLLLSQESQAVLKERRVVDSLAFDYYLRGRDYLRRLPNLPVLSNAEGMFSKAIEVDAGYADAHAGMCDTLLERYALTHSIDDLTSAEAACQRALELDQKSVTVYVALGNLYRNSGEYQKAEETFNSALHLNEKSAEAFVGLGETYMATSRYAEAETIFSETIRMQPNYWPAHMKMANLLMATGRTEEAIPYYQRINYLLPESGIASNNLGGAFYLIGRFEEAAATWQESLRHSPTAAIFTNLGSSLYFLRRFDSAADMYRQAIELTPNDYENWGNLADAYRFTDPNLATQSYNEALALASKKLATNPQDATTLGLMAHYYANTGQAQEAREFLQKAETLAPDDMYTYYFAATAHAALNDADSAMIALDRALTLGYFKNLVRSDAGLDGLRNQTQYQKLMDETQ